MKILLINNFHYPRGGSERAYFDTAEILRSRGHEVAFFAMKDPRNKPTEWDKYFPDGADYNAENLSLWQKIKMAQNIIFNFRTKRNLKKLIAGFKPDIAHLHNIYHQLSPSVIYALKKHKIPMVMTLHDYKLISPNYNLYLNGKIWEKKNLLSCVKDGCVKNSYAKSVVCAVEKIIHDILGSYEKIDIFISPSRFLLNKFKEFGFQGKIKYIPNPLGKFFHNTKATDDSSGPLVYYGRVSKEKGIDTVIRAMKNLKNEKLLIVGDGPEKGNLEKLAENVGVSDQVKFLSAKYGDELKKVLNQAKAIIVPSVWYENMPYTVVETLTMGKIIIASRIGGIPDLITDKKNGFLFEAGNSVDIAEKIKNLKKYDLETIRSNAMESAKICDPEKYYRNLIAIYEKLDRKSQ